MLKVTILIFKSVNFDSKSVIFNFGSVNFNYEVVNFNSESVNLIASSHATFHVGNVQKNVLPIIHHFYALYTILAHVSFFFTIIQVIILLKILTIQRNSNFCIFPHCHLLFLAFSSYFFFYIYQFRCVNP
jgi:hypothetical protein